MKRVLFPVPALLALSGAAAGQTVNLNLVATVDLSSASDATNFPSRFIGSNPSAIAWNGSSLWVGGYNQAGAAATTAVVRVDGVLSGSPTFGAAFGAIATTPNLRGITGLAVQGNTNTLAVSYDPGAGSGDAVRAFDADTQALRWRLGGTPGGSADTTRRGNGVAFDPGFNAGGTNVGVAYLSIASGRRHVLDTVTGAYINGQNAGAILNATNTTWRDLAFDPADGDVYAREGNQIFRGNRTADNAFNTLGYIGNQARATGVDNQNIAFVNSTLFGNFLVANDRPSNAAQQFGAAVEAFDLAGNQLAVNFLGLNAPAGNGAYDFAWDAGSQTLAVSDFANRQAYIFTPVPEPAGVVAAAAGAAGVARAARRRRARPVAGP